MANSETDRQMKLELYQYWHTERVNNFEQANWENYSNAEYAKWE